jgi:hypothetical protein
MKNGATHFAGGGARQNGSTLADVKQLAVHADRSDFCRSATYSQKAGKNCHGTGSRENGCLICVRGLPAIARFFSLAGFSSAVFSLAEDRPTILS